MVGAHNKRPDHPLSLDSNPEWSGQGSPIQDPGADGTGVVCVLECGCDYNPRSEMPS